MSKPQVAQSIKDKDANYQNHMPKNHKTTILKTSVLSVATAMGALALSQGAYAELTWGNNTSSNVNSYPQQGSYQPDNYQPQSYQPDNYQAPSSQPNSSYQADSGASSFTAAAIAAERGDVNALYNYEQEMSGGLFAMYPPYWRMNLDLNSQSPAAVTQFARQYPETVMAEKLVADFAETKAGSNDYAAVRQVANPRTERRRGGRRR